MSMALSGVSVCVVPSTWLWKVTPSSAIRRSPSSEKTWEHRAVPGGEPVQTAHAADQRLTRAEVEMVAVAEDDLRAGPADVGGAQASHDAVGADRHEGRGLDLAVGQGQGAGPCGAGGALDRELEHRRAPCVILSEAKEP
jgi:hypothetical protein